MTTLPSLSLHSLSLSILDAIDGTHISEASHPWLSASQLAWLHRALYDIDNVISSYTLGYDVDLVDVATACSRYSLIVTRLEEAEHTHILAECEAEASHPSMD